VTLHLSAQSLVVVCPDCGQRYDPAKAAKVARVRTRDGRTIKPGRVEAQDVSTVGHRNGRHHRAHRMVTARTLDGRALVTEEIAEMAFESRVRYGAPEDEVRCERVLIDEHTVLWFARLDELASIAVEIEDSAQRSTCERIIRAARAVREDYPWWRAYLHELSMGADEIARGFTVSHDNRADVLFERRAGVFALDASGPTLRGLL
jgi:hypothetical protein